jgi:hypothetical protein
LEVAGDGAEPWPTDSTDDPWTLAARSSGFTPLEGVGDGLGGEVEITFDFVPGELAEVSEQTPAQYGPAQYGQTAVGQDSVNQVAVTPAAIAPAAGASEVPDPRPVETAPSRPAKGKLLVRNISPPPPADGDFTLTIDSNPIVGVTGQGPVVVNFGKPNPSDRAKKVALDLGLPQTGAPETDAGLAPPTDDDRERARILGPSVDHASLPPGEELDNGTKIFTLFK